jgi:hypothetical protein
MLAISRTCGRVHGSARAVQSQKGETGTALATQEITMTKTSIASSSGRALLLVAALLPFGACSQTTSAQRNQRAPLAATADNQRVSEDVLRDPAARIMLMNQMTTQIQQKTHGMNEPTYRATRPNLIKQLRDAGFSEEDAGLILADVDRARGADANLAVGIR